MFASRHTRSGAAGLVDVAFTDRHGGVSPPPYATLDLGERSAGSGDCLAANLAAVAAAFDVPGLALMSQVHGAGVSVVDGEDPPPWSSGAVIPTCDALLTAAGGVALCVRVADCVPVVLADPAHGVVGVAHAGRAGLVAGVVGAAVQTMAELGAERVEAWIGPYVCGGCYEVPEAMRAEVSATHPAAFATTTWGTPSLDLGAAAAAQLRSFGCVVNDVSRCTRESDDLFSYRRDGALAGRSAGLVVLRRPGDG